MAVFDDVGEMMSRPFTAAWIAGEPSATRFLARGFDDPALRRAAVERARPIGAEVLAAVRAQEAERPPSPSRAAALEALESGAAAVVTGQQVGLFLGPLYTLHKAAAAVVAARALALESGRAVVPVFWLQTEDHDFAEVCRAVVPGAHGLTEVAVADDGRRVPLSERVFDEADDPAALVRALALGGPFAAETEALLGRHYRVGATWPDAFAGVLAELFADDGLVIVDPRKMAALARPIHRFAWQAREHIAAALAARAAELSAAGFDVQVGVRPGATLSCVEHRGARHRLMDNGEVGPPGDGATIDVLAALDAQPERFTTTALLRPLLQDQWLPTAAVVGGPGELAYFAELAPLYALAGLTPPLAVPRARFQLVGATARRLAEQLGLALDDAALPAAELAARLAGTPADDATYDALRATLDQGLAALARDAAARGDATFDKHAKKTAELIAGALDKLRDRGRRHALLADQLTADRLARFVAWLAPRGAPQERVLAFPPFAAQVGPRALVRRIVDATVPFDATLRRIDL